MILKARKFLNGRAILVIMPQHLGKIHQRTSSLNTHPRDPNKTHINRPNIQKPKIGNTLGLHPREHPIEGIGEVEDHIEVEHKGAELEEGAIIPMETLMDMGVTPLTPMEGMRGEIIPQERNTRDHKGEDKEIIRINGNIPM